MSRSSACFNQSISIYLKGLTKYSWVDTIALIDMKRSHDIICLLTDRRGIYLKIERLI